MLRPQATPWHHESLEYTPTVIRMENVRKRYPGAEIDALRNIDLQIGEGEFVSIVGRSGSGKTTLLNLIGGLDTAFEGSIEIDGSDLAGMEDPEIAALRNRSIGFVFQAYHLLDHLSCGENVALAGLFARGSARRDRTWFRQRVVDVLAAVGLDGAAGRSPTTLSGGERQRVAVARALFLEPAILLCDEPTGNLDSRTGREVVELLSGLHHREHMVIIAATHDEAVSEACDRRIALRDGRLVEGRGDLS
jgi:ABC-type lipoprotein export system ATPase subunit